MPNETNKELTPARRKRIVAAYNALKPGQAKTDKAIDYVTRIKKKRSLSHFLDTASAAETTRLEGILYDG